MIWKPFFGQAGSQAPAVPPLENRPHPIALKGLLGLQLQVGPSINSVVWSAYTTSWGHAVVGSEFPKQPPFGCIKPWKSWDKLPFPHLVDPRISSINRS